MPSIKFRQSLRIGSGTALRSILAGSVVVSAPVFTGGTAGSQETVEASGITGLTASHFMLLGNASVATTQATCVIPLLSKTGTNIASILFAYIAGSGGGAASDVRVTIPYIAFKV